MRRQQLVLAAIGAFVAATAAASARPNPPAYDTAGTWSPSWNTPADQAAPAEPAARHGVFKRQQRETRDARQAHDGRPARDRPARRAGAWRR